MYLVGKKIRRQKVRNRTSRLKAKLRKRNKKRQQRMAG